MSTFREFNDSNEAPFTQMGAPSGMVKNAPHEAIPDGAVAYLRNAHAYPTEIQPRLGTRIYSDAQPPALSGRTGYTASKSGNIITSLSGDIFSETDVSHYWVWPGDPNIHDEIQEFISETQVRVRDSSTYSATTGCWMHGKCNLNVFHESERQKIDQWGSELYIANSIALTAQTKALCLSLDGLNNSVSDWSPQDDYACIGNSGGIFLLDMSTSPAKYFKRNTPVPSILIESNTKSKTRIYRHDYTYSMCRLLGTGIRDRTANGADILQESGTCALNPNTSPPRDYGTNWISKKIGRGELTQGRLVCGNVAAANILPSYWQGLTGDDSAIFKLTVDDIEEEFMIDCGIDGYNVQSMDDLATAIQDTIRISFPYATCEWLEDHFVFTSGEVDGSTMDYGAAGAGTGTDISTIINITAAEGASLDNTYVFQSPHQVQWFYVPKSPSRPATPEQHWTHYTVYRTGDIGEKGVTPRVGPSGEELVPLKFSWAHDIRVAGAFLASKDTSGLVTIHIGSIQLEDEGTPFEWEDGEVDTVTTYISSTSFRTTASGEEEYYYAEAKTRMAAAIGGGRVFRGTQTDDEVVILGGGTVTADDVGKTVHWSTGGYGYITSFEGTNRFKVSGSRDRAEQGFTIDPIRRVINDTVTDDKLRYRQGEKYVGLLEHRFRQAMPNINVLEIVPGFLLTAVRNGSKIYYCDLPIDKKYIGGYYLPNRQVIDRIEDSIQTIKKAPNKFLVWCTNSFWGGPTNQPDVATIPEFGDVYGLLFVDIIDAQVGCIDFGSLQEISYGVFQLRCTDNTWRQCTALGYIKDLGDMSVHSSTGQDIVKRDFYESWNLSASIYGVDIGHILWLRDRS